MAKNKRKRDYDEYKSPCKGEFVVRRCLRCEKEVRLRKQYRLCVRCRERSLDHVVEDFKIIV